MTKKEMLYEIISNTKLHSLNEWEVNDIIRKTSKNDMTEVYNAFTKDKENAIFYYTIIAQRTM